MISIVVPLFNEAENIELLWQRITKTVGIIHEKYEILFIDDGSTDSSFEILKKIEKKDKNVKIFSFRRNQGKAEALTLGFQQAKGEYIITLDADLQDRPEQIPAFLKKLREGYDLVAGWRKNRKDASRMIIASRFFNFIMSVLWGAKLHDYNCGLKAYTKDAAKSLHLYGGMHRFIPLLLYEQGFLVTELIVDHDQRKFGKSKFGFSKVIRDIPDMFTILFITRYGKRPLHLFGGVGIFSTCLGTIFFSYLTVLHFMGQAIGRRPLFIASILLILAGLQILFTGFLADLIISISQSPHIVEGGPVHMLKYGKSKETNIK